MNRRDTGWLPRAEGLAAGRSEVVAVLDIGSIKITCVIARLKPQSATSQDAQHRSHAIEVLGVGHQRAVGTKRGAIVDMEATERGIRLAVDAAERMAGVTVESVVVNIGAGRLASQNFAASVDVIGSEVQESDIRRVLEAGRGHSVQHDRVALHAIPIAFSLDGSGGIRDPRGMSGGELGVDMHVVSVQAAPARNIVLGVERCHLTVEAVVASPYAAGLGAMVDDEAELGSLVIDMGGGTTTYGIFAHGRFIHSDGIAVGGHHVTMDLARGLSTSIEAAERIKTLYGSALGAGSHHGEVVTVPLVGEADGAASSHSVARAQITEIVRPRVEEVLELLRDRLRATPFVSLAGGRAVLTGGASQLPGMLELAERILGLKVRIGRPVGVKNLPDAAKGPAFAVTAGLLAYPLVAGVEHHRRSGGAVRLSGSSGYLARVGNWIRESF